MTGRGLGAGGVALLALAGLALWLAWGDWRAHRALLAAGVPVEAQVIARRMDHGGDWWLAYAFAGPDGAPARGEGAAARVVAVGLDADPYRRGAPVRVLVLPGQPDRSMPASAPEPGRQMRWVAVALPLGIAGLGLLSLAFAAPHRPGRPASPADRPAPPLRLSPKRVVGFWALWLALGLGAGAAGLFHAAQAPVRADAALWQAAVQGRTVERLGEVTGRSLSSRITGRQLGTGQPRFGTVLFLDYALDSPDGVRRTGRSRVDPVEYDRLGIGAPVLVRILPEDPDRHALALAAPALDDWRLRTLAIILGLGAVLSALALVVEMLGRRRAAASGIARDVRVTRHERVIAGRMAWWWEDAAGGQGAAPMTAPARLPPVGATVRVRIDPKTGHGWPESAL